MLMGMQIKESSSDGAGIPIKFTGGKKEEGVSSRNALKRAYKA